MIGRRVLTVWLLVISLGSLFAPLIAPRDPLYAESGQELRAPSAQHPLGTDLLGRDVWSRLLYGGARTLSSALLATGIAVGPGLLIGLLAGFAGGWPDRVIGVLLDALLALPGLLLVLTMTALLGSGVVSMAVAVGAAGLAPYARVVRAATREARSRPYVEAAYGLGANRARILFWHILPNIARPLRSFAAVTFSWALLNGAALAFLGFGGDPAAPDWGVMLTDGRQVLRLAPWVGLAPGVVLTLTVFAINQLAD